MIDLEQLQLVAQLIDNMEVLINKLEKAYAENNAVEFNKYKKEVLEIQKKISGMVK